MIPLTRLNGPVFLLNPDLIERAEATPDTVVTLTGGTKYVVAESLETLAALVRGYRARVLATVPQLRPEQIDDDLPRPEPVRTLRVLPLDGAR